MVGSSIEANYRGKGKWFPGSISKKHASGNYDIKYADGDSERNVPPALVRAVSRQTGSDLISCISKLSQLFDLSDP